MYKCESCGKIVKVIKDGGGKLLCCNKPMIEYAGLEGLPEKLTSIKEIIEFAIKREEEAYKFYKGLAKKAKRPGMNKVFEELAAQELKHKTNLLNIKKGAKGRYKKFYEISSNKIMDMKLSDILLDVTPDTELTYQQALILAMKREKQSYNLYTTIAEIANDKRRKLTFKTLANMEAEHKLKIEREYDDYIFTEG